LGELAKFSAIRRADQAVELLPSIVIGLLRTDLRKQALLAQAPRIITLQLCTNLTLALPPVSG